MEETELLRRHSIGATHAGPTRSPGTDAAVDFGRSSGKELLFRVVSHEAAFVDTPDAGGSADRCRSRSFLPERTLQLAATCDQIRILKRQHLAVERTSAIVVRLTAKVQPGRLDLPNSADAPPTIAKATELPVGLTCSRLL